MKTPTDRKKIYRTLHTSDATYRLAGKYVLGDYRAIGITENNVHNLLKRGKEIWFVNACIFYTII